MPVAIVTDSAAALPTDLVDAHRITVVPMWLTVDGTAVREGECDPETLAAAVAVATSGPSPGEFAEAVASRQGPDGVLVCTIAGAMSSTHEAAVLGAGQVEGPVRVLDTGTAAGAEALVVLAAAEAAEAGRSLDEVERVAKRAMDEVRLVATVPSLDHLVRSGRVPGIAGRAGRALGIAPLFEFRDGGARPLRPALSHEAALDRMIARWRRSAVAGARLHVAALHAQAEEQARVLLDRVAAEVTPATAFLGEFGTVMVVHTGPGLVGLAWRWEPTADD